MSIVSSSSVTVVCEIRTWTSDARCSGFGVEFLNMIISFSELFMFWVWGQVQCRRNGCLRDPYVYLRRHLPHNHFTITDMIKLCSEIRWLKPVRGRRDGCLRDPHANLRRAMLRVYAWVFLIFVYSSILGDIRLWVGPRKEHPLFSWDLTRALIGALAFRV